MVMTTEVLRNMLYAGSSHADRSRLRGDGRGALPRRPVPRRGLGGGDHPPAGVGGAGLACPRPCRNAEEFGEWLETVRGETATIVEERRPVPLYQHVMVGRKLFDLFADDGGRRDAQVEPRAAEGRPRRLAPRPTMRARRRPAQRRARSAAGGAGRRQRPRGPGCPSRSTWSSGWTATGLLPAIVFIFSRVGCDAAVSQCLERGPAADHARGARRDPGVRRGHAAATCPTRTCTCWATTSFLEGLDARRRRPPRGHAADVQGVRRGAASRAAWCKVVFATETLALGINMPARSVVIEKLVEVERRDPRRHHAGGVHPADRPGRPPRHRRRGARRSCCGSRASTRRRSPAWPRRRTYPLQVVVPAVVQHGRQPRRPGRPRHRPRAARVVVRAVPGRPGGRRAGAAAAARPRTRSTATRDGRHLPPRRLHGVRRAASRLSDAEAAQARERQGRPARRGHSRRWRR